MTTQNKHLCLKIFLVLSLIFITSVVFWQTRYNDFVAYDDDTFVTENSHVQKGFNAETIKWAFTAPGMSNWNPLTWLSYMLDYQLYGLKPAGYHLTNLLLHVSNTVLLFLLLSSFTAAPLRSAFVAALFALHPLHVESVAWIAERKDVLSTFFFMCTLWTYGIYARQKDIKKYLLCLIFFVLGLLAKPMLVTLPFVLLLLDYWPLERFCSTQSGNNVSLTGSKNISEISGSIAFRLLMEKIPFFVLSFIVSIITIHAQKIAMSPLQSLPMKIRVMNALLSYVKYLGKLIWPSHLSVFYPIPVHKLSVWHALSSGMILAIISFFVIRFSRRHKYLAVGWLWYLGTLVPVIGLVQVGMQAMADRYTYIPFIGLFIIVTWGIPEFLKKFKYQKILLSMLACAIIFAMTIVTSRQLRFWQNSFSLFSHAIEVTDENFLAYNNLGYAFIKQGKFSEALPCFSRAMTINPTFSKKYADARYNMAYTLIMLGKFNAAIPHLLEAIKIEPESAEAQNLLASCLYMQKNYNEALVHYSEALRIKPDFADAHNNLGMLLADLGKYEEARSHYLAALKVDPSADTLNNLGVLYENKGKYEDAVKSYSSALKLKPGFQVARSNLQSVLRKISVDRKEVSDKENPPDKELSPHQKEK